MALPEAEGDLILHYSFTESDLSMIRQRRGTANRIGFAMYLKRATQALRESGKLAKDAMLQYLSPLGWEHINLTGDYAWRQNRWSDDGQFRPLGFRNNE